MPLSTSISILMFCGYLYVFVKIREQEDMEADKYFFVSAQLN